MTTKQPGSPSPMEMLMKLHELRKYTGCDKEEMEKRRLALLVSFDREPVDCSHIEATAHRGQEEKWRYDRIEKFLEVLSYAAPEVIRALVRVHDHKGNITAFWSSSEYDDGVSIDLLQNFEYWWYNGNGGGAFDGSPIRHRTVGGKELY